LTSTSAPAGGGSRAPWSSASAARRRWPRSATPFESATHLRLIDAINDEIAMAPAGLKVALRPRDS
jgi:hypothetical protein